jgi:hypothetical protein
MRRWVLGLFIGSVIAILLAIGGGITVNAYYGWAYKEIIPLASTETRNIWFEDASCSGREAYVDVADVGPAIKGCLYGDFHEIQMVRYESSFGQSAYAMRHPYDSSFFTVKGLCEGLALCAYAPDTDTLLVQTPLLYWRYGAAIFHNVSRFISREEGALGEVTYRFSPTEEPQQVRLGSFAPTVHAMAFSENGAWAVVEVSEHGLVVIDIATRMMRRIQSPGYTYGHGYDPKFELAITNDGRTVAAAGYRVGLNVYEITDSCGEWLPTGDAHVDTYMPYQTICPSAYLSDLNTVFGDLTSTHMPKFTSDGATLSLVTKMANNTTKSVLVGSEGAQQTQLQYVALGDSFTSGEGETHDIYYRELTNTGVHTCHTSIRSYPYLIAGAWSRSVQSIACSGARSLDIVSSQGYQGQNERLHVVEDAEAWKQQAYQGFVPGIVPQLNIVQHTRPKLISLSIGGNDVGMIDKLKACLAPTTCDWASEPDKKRAMAREIRDVYQPLRRLLSEIKRSSPASDILVIGYPKIINESATASCDFSTDFLLDSSERQLLNEAIQLLNTVIRHAAFVEGVQYGNIEDSLLGHRLCDNTETPAMNTLRFGGDIAPIGILPDVRFLGSESFHPTPFGHTLIAHSLLRQYHSPDISRITCSACEDVPLPPPSGYWGSSVDVGRRQFLSTITSDTTIETGDTLTFHHLGDTFREGRAVTVSLALGSKIIMTNTGSAIDASTITVPDVEGGFYLLRVTGETKLGEEIELYQVVPIGKLSEMNLAVTPQSVLPALGRPAGEVRRTSVSGHNIDLLSDILGVQVWREASAAPLLLESSSHRADVNKQAKPSDSDSRTGFAVELFIICGIVVLAVIGVYLWLRPKVPSG